MTRTIMLAGAPETKNLEWNEKSLLPAERLGTLTPTRSIDSATESDSDASLCMNKTSLPKWRKLEMDRLRMRPILPKLEIESPSKNTLPDVYPSCCRVWSLSRKQRLQLPAADIYWGGVPRARHGPSQLYWHASVSGAARLRESTHCIMLI